MRRKLKKSGPQKANVICQDHNMFLETNENYFLIYLLASIMKSIFYPYYEMHDNV